MMKIHYLGIVFFSLSFVIASCNSYQFIDSSNQIVKILDGGSISYILYNEGLCVVDRVDLVPHKGLITIREYCLWHEKKDSLVFVFITTRMPGIKLYLYKSNNSLTGRKLRYGFVKFKGYSFITYKEAFIKVNPKKYCDVKNDSDCLLVVFEK